MRKILLSLTGILMLQLSPSSHAGGVDLNVILAGEIQPGVYGRVELGNAPRPQAVYAHPRVVEHRYVRQEPIYLYVPPEHARHWDRHCRYYNSCGRPVYFVRSVEYEPGFNMREYHRRHEHHDHDHYNDDRHDHDRYDHDDDHGHGHRHH